jgi:hypothetical protein
MELPDKPSMNSKVVHVIYAQLLSFVRELLTLPIPCRRDSNRCTHSRLDLTFRAAQGLPSSRPCVGTSVAFQMIR